MYYIYIDFCFLTNIYKVLKEEREKKKLTSFKFMTDSINAVGGHNRRLGHVVNKFDCHKSNSKLKVHIS